MSMVTGIVAKDDVLHVSIQGKFDADEAKRNFLQIMEAVNKNKSKRVLVDGRKVTGEPTVIERYFIAEFFAHVSTWRGADVEPHNRQQFSYALVHPTLDRERLGETVALNRGMNIKAFDNLPDAAAWLDVDPADAQAISDVGAE